MAEAGQITPPTTSTTWLFPNDFGVPVRAFIAAGFAVIVMGLATITICETN